MITIRGTSPASPYAAKIMGMPSKDVFANIAPMANDACSPSRNPNTPRPNSMAAPSMANEPR